MKKLLWEIVLVVFVIIAVFITTCMLSKNDYNVIQFGNKIWLIAEDNMGEYNKNSLLIIKEDKRNVTVNDMVFYYTENEQGNEVKLGKITAINNNSYTIDGDEIAKEMVIAPSENAETHTVLGLLLAALTSRYGYLIFIIIPILVAFIYQLVLVANELNSEPEPTKKTRKTSKNKKK